MNPLVIISMTTISARNGTLGETLASLAAQNVQSDAIAHSLTPGCISPLLRINRLQRLNVIDCGPVTKLYAVMSDLPPNTIIITVDDDQTYNSNWLGILLEGVRRFPDCAVGFSGWNLGTIPVFAWGPCDVLEGWAGAAYRKSWFDAEILNPPLLTRSNDDVWISSYLHRKGVRRMLLGPPKHVVSPRTSPWVPGLHDQPGFRRAARAAAETLFSFPLTSFDK